MIDRSCDETHLQVLAPLRARLAEKGDQHSVCCIDPGSAVRVEAMLGESPARTFVRISPRLHWAPGLDQAAIRNQAEVIHAWGLSAAAACKARVPQLPLVLTVLDPATCIDVARWLRSFSTGAAVVAGSQTVRSRLLAAGLEQDRVVVIRGPADFAAINQARRENLRQRVVGAARPVILTGGPASRSGGQYYALWACAIIRQVCPDLTMLMPYDSPERKRLIRFVREIRMPSLLTLPDSRFTWEQLAACADVFLVAATDDVCTEPLASAMAAGVPIVAAAVRSVCEIIADRHNGLLCRKPEPKLLAARLLTALDDESLRREVTEVARGQAYEVFGPGAFADNYRRVYRSLIDARPLAEDVRDTAMVA